MVARIFVDKGYNRIRRKSGITDEQLRELADEVIVDPKKGSLGGGVYKKRVDLGDGESAGARTIVFYHHEDKVYFYDGWEKKDVSESGQEIPPDLLKAYKTQSKVYRQQTEEQLATDLKSKDLVEIKPAIPEKKDD